MPTPTPLELCQAWFEQNLLEQTPASPPPLTARGAGKLSPAEALAVYQRAYIARLTESLGDTYPAVWRVLGDEGFFQAAREYIAAQPSTSYNLSDFGELLAAFLKNHAATKELPFLPDLARFEWLFRDVFHAPGHQPIASDRLARLDRGDARLAFAPSLRFFTSPYQAYAIWQLRDSPDATLDQSAWQSPEQLMLLKQGEQIYCFPLNGACYAVLQNLAQASDLSTGLAQAERDYHQLTTEDVGQALQLILQAGGIVDIF